MPIEIHTVEAIDRSDIQNYLSTRTLRKAASHSMSADHNLNDPLIYVRALHFAATITAAGVVWFIAFIAEPAFRNAKQDTGVTELVRNRLAWIPICRLATPTRAV